MSYSNSIDSSVLLAGNPSNLDNIAKILLIGETGAGKSTFINYLSNHFHKGTLSNLKIAIPCKHHPVPTEHSSHNEFNIQDNTQSKTSDCTQYMFTDSATNKQYLFLDTPGLCDTRGLKQDEHNMNKIIDAITELGNLTAVIIVVNGSMNRLTTHLRTIIACLNGNIPDIILENVIVILSNVKKHESSFDLNVLNLHGKVYPFYMQNGAFVSDPRTWKQSIRDELQYDWEHSMKQIKSILETIDSFKQRSIESFVQLKKIRNEIKSIMHQARLEMIQIQKIQDELAQLDLAYKQADEDTVTYQDYTRIQTIEKLEVVDAAFHSTLCANCNQVCHSNCHLNESSMFGAQILSRCLVMSNGRCQQCRNHCSYINHYHAKKTVQLTQENLHDVLTDLKKNYDHACANRNGYQEKMLTVSETKVMLENALKQKVHEIKSKSRELCDICSSLNLAIEFKYLIKQLKSELNLLRNPSIKLQNENLIKHLIKFTQLVEENQEENRQKRSPMQIIDKEQTIERKATDIKSLKTAELIQLYHNATEHALLTSILNELHQRAQGKSTSPLLTPNEILLINKNLEKYNHKSIQELSYSYRKLQQQIHQLIDSDILEIVHVNPELLIENFIVQTLLDNKEKNEDTFFNTTTHSSSHPMINSFSEPTFLIAPQTVHTTPYPNNGPTSSLDFPSPYPNVVQHSSSTASHLVHPNIELLSSHLVYPLPYPNTPSKSLETKISSNTSLSIGFSHLNIAPYPSINDPSPMPALPDSYFSTIHANKEQPPTLFRFDDSRYDLAEPKLPTSPADNQKHTPMPMPMKGEQHLTNLRHFDAESSSNERGSRPDVIPHTGDSFSLSNSFSKYRRDDTPTSFDNEDFHLLDTSRLLSMYTDVHLKNNESRKEAISQELIRRCYGDYPLLVMEKRSLFEEKIKLNETKTIEELVKIHMTIIRKIRAYLKNDDVTLINDIPQELIVEVSALNQLLVSKRRV